jgi:hypothetical protein
LTLAWWNGCYLQGPEEVFEVSALLIAVLCASTKVR